MSYKIIATINGRKYELNNCGPPSHKEVDMLSSLHTIGYVYSQFKDIAKSRSDITHIDWYNGSKIITSFSYKNGHWDNELVQALFVK
jgi:hypothetical protein